MEIKFNTFKIFLPKKGKKEEYFKVMIFSSKKSMYKIRKILEDEGANHMGKMNFAAICTAYESKKDQQQFGVLMFTRNSARKSGIVSHEIAHAVSFYWPYREKDNWSKILGEGKTNERFAWVLGDFVSQYWRQWHSIKW